ncbi:hypothetical protein B0H34DRAFT_96310 [Crassisporium funariophilum]|nr:hypothetical protein B0H34DRAFT_96310 [Crassisporium funariophilum]
MKLIPSLVEVLIPRYYGLSSGIAHIHGWHCNHAKKISSDIRVALIKGQSGQHLGTASAKSLAFHLPSRKLVLFFQKQVLISGHEISDLCVTHIPGMMKSSSRLSQDLSISLSEFGRVRTRGRERVSADAVYQSHTPTKRDRTLQWTFTCMLACH